MKKKQSVGLGWMYVLALTASGFPFGALAEQTSVSEASNRTKYNIGADLGVGAPSPGLIGLNANYNVFDYLRANLGYSKISVSGFGVESSATTLGMGAQALIPGWSLSPAVGLHYGHIIYSGDGTLQVGGFKKSGGHIYGSAGIDYQSSTGFNFGLGMIRSFRAGIGSSGYLRLGWYLDLFT
jgi:hypothetical protein